MNKVHSALLTYLRNAMDQNESNTLTRVLKTKTDDQIIRLMFMNFRARENGTRGLRLTNLGLQIMLGYFKSYDIDTAGSSEPRELSAEELLYLDRKAKLPYHISETGHLIVFDRDLGIKLMLADGDIKIAAEIDDMALTASRA